MQFLPSSSASRKANPPSSVTLASSTALRLRHLANQLYQLGPRPLFELLAEAAQGAPLLERLEAYGRLDPKVVRALGADALPPTILRIK